MPSTDDQLPMLIAEWPRSSREAIRIQLALYNGNPVVDIRAWYVGADGVPSPGRKGITLSVRQLPALSAGVARALKVARQHELLASED